MEVNIENTKIELIQWLTTLEDSDIIQKILDLRKSESTYQWDNLSNTEKRSIELGLADAQKGNLSPNSEAEKIYRKWL